MAIDGGIVVAGAELDDSAGSSGSGSGGSAYVFRTSDGGATYGNVTKLTPADAGANIYFGRAVAIDGGTIAVTAMPYVAGTYVTRYCFAYVFDPNAPTPPSTSRPRLYRSSASWGPPVFSPAPRASASGHGGGGK